jgi:LysM repeat protein
LIYVRRRRVSARPRAESPYKEGDMSTRLHPRIQRTALTSLICFGLLLAACTRSATTATVPTAGPTGGVSSTEGLTTPSDQDATMAAIGTQVAGQLTQTAVASGAGGGQEQTPGAPGATAPAGATPAPGTTPAAPGITDTQAAQPGQSSDTPAAPGATVPAQPADTSTPVPAVGTPCPNPYTVQAGDWIYKIARNCNVAVSALIAANPNINPSYISPGQQLNMPAAGTTGAGGDPPAACSGPHTVVTGESLYKISFTCGLTVEQLAAANNIVYPYTIYVGQQLNIP